MKHKLLKNSFFIGLIILLSIYTYRKYFGYTFFHCDLVTFTYNEKTIEIKGKDLWTKLGGDFYVLYDSIYIPKREIADFNPQIFIGPDRKNIRRPGEQLTNNETSEKSTRYLFIDKKEIQSPDERD